MEEEKIKKIIETPEIKYYTIDNYGQIIEETDFGFEFNKLKKEIGNYFKTEEEAEEYLEDLKVKAEIKNIANELNGDKKIDWNDKEQTKYSLFYDYTDGDIWLSPERDIKMENSTYCLNDHFAYICTKRIGETRLKRYLKRN